MFGTHRASRRHHLKRTVLSAAGSLLAATALIAATAPAASADAHCSDGNVCVWNGVYDGPKNNYGINDAGYKFFDHVKQSIRNRFTNRRVLTAAYFGPYLVTYDCVNPGDNRAGGAFLATVIYIDAPGTRC